ncbi:MAG TPA: OmpW family outer membrane protein [Rhizomicrobium sp.]|jgi:outer membrane protein|nr:OmpW family outer membrane protein [Rhizomicrobium sp.]
MRILKTLLAATALVALATPALADAGDVLLRVRAVGVFPDVSDNIPGIKVGADGNLVPEVDGTYFLTDNISFELIAATTKHTTKIAGLGQIGSVWLLPPTLTAQYNFAPDSDSIRPYIGAGVNYTFMYSAEDSGLLPAHVSYGNNFGWALQAGADIPVGTSGLFLNVDVKKVFLSTDVKLGGVKLGATKLDPWLVGFGLGFKL